jgi:hypothetical protein
MGKRTLLILALSVVIILQSTAFAMDTEGEIIFRDTLYGAAIGALLGTAFYLADQDDFGEKISTGLLIGSVGGLIYGFTETTSLVEIRNDEIKVAVPTPVIRKEGDRTIYYASIFKTEY